MCQYTFGNTMRRVFRGFLRAIEKISDAVLFLHRKDMVYKEKVERIELWRYQISQLSILGLPRLYQSYFVL